MPPGLAEDRARALALTPVSRETAACLDQFVDLLLAWQRRMNLVASSTLQDAVDPPCRQLAAACCAGAGGTDLGRSGFGCRISRSGRCLCARGNPGNTRSSGGEQRKEGRLFSVRRPAPPACRRLLRRGGSRRSSSRRPAYGRRERPCSCAIGRLAGGGLPVVDKGCRRLFPKGQGVDAELTDAAKCWNIEATLALSRTDPKARIVVVRGLEPVPGSHSPRVQQSGQQKQVRLRE